MLAQLLLQPRPSGAALDPRRQRFRLDLEHAVEPPQIHRHHRPVAESRLDPADDAGAAAERDHRGTAGLGPAQHRLDLRLVARTRDQVRRILELPPEPTDDVSVGLAQCPRGPLVLVVGEQVAEPVRLLQPRLAQLDRVQRHRRLRLAAEPEPLPNPSGSLAQLLLRGRLILVPPPPVLQPSLGTHKLTTRRDAVPPAGHSSAAQPCVRQGVPRPYQWTPFIKCAKATASVLGGLSGASSPLEPFAACESGKSL